MVTHRERVPITVDANTKVHTFGISPGKDNVFPWLSKIARQYEQYRFHSLSIDFVSMVPTTFGGAFYLAFDYDSADQTDAADVEPADLTSWNPSSRTSIWDSARITIDPKRMNARGPLFVRQSIDVGSTSTRLSDVGYMAFGTSTVLNSQGAPWVGEIGELYLSYTVELITPQINSQNFAIANTVYSDFAETGASQPFGTGLTGAVNPGSVIRYVDSYNLEIVGAGRWLMELSGLGTTQPAAGRITLGPVTGGTITDVPQTLEDWGSNATGFLQQWVVDVTGQSLTFNLANVLAAVSVLNQFRASFTKLQD